MKTAKPFGTEVTILGQYAYIKCDNCHKEVGNWFTGLYGFVDCNCTLHQIGSRYRTLGKLPTNTPTT
jgi:hypothetical protein